MASEPTGRLSFQPRARLIRTIGDRLISGPEAAVIELVKNSHDADASYVKIKFVPPLRSGGGSIIVEDDGHGMKLDDIESKWMEPATTDKTERSSSPGGRKMLGSKGIGRFAAAKLGRWLDLETTAYVGQEKKKLESIHVHDVDWEAFDKAKYLSEIELDYRIAKASIHTGTRLEIKDLRESWTRSRLEGLHLELRRMISPLEEPDRTEFKIFLDLSACTKKTCGFDGLDILQGPASDLIESAEPFRVRPFPLLKSCDYEVEGTFDEAGRFSGELTIHRGDLEPEAIELSLPIDEEAGEDPCGLVLVHLFVFDRETQAVKSSMARAGMGQLTAKEARALLDDIAGVAIYRDRFRIRPYGDPENDWLTLDKRRVQTPAMRIGHNQVSGLVIIDDEEKSGLVEQSSREGLEENGSYRRLRRLILTLFAASIEPKRYQFRRGADISRTPKSDFTRVYESARFQWAEKISSVLPLQQRLEFEETITEESERLTALLRILDEKQAGLEAKVTLGLILAEVLHEGRTPVAFLQDEARRLNNWWPSLWDDSAEAGDRKTEVPRILRAMRTEAGKLRDLFKALNPLAGGRRGKPIYYSPTQVVADCIYPLSRSLKEHNTSVSHKPDPAIDDVLGYRQDLATAVTNILKNSIYWLGYHHVEKAKINIVSKKVDDHCYIELCDNGNGIPSEFRDHIFDVGFTLKTEGSGLGLSIAREALARSRATLELLESDKGACFLIRIPFKGE